MGTANKPWELTYRINFRNGLGYTEYHKTQEDAIKAACKRTDGLIPTELQHVVDDKWTTIGVFSRK